MDEDTITNEFVLFNQYTLDLKDLDNELDKLKIKEDSLIERMKHLESHKYNPDCDICMENSESIIDAKVGVESDLATIAIEKNEKLEEKNRLLLAIDTRKKYKKLNEELTKLISDEEKVSRDINTLINKLSTTETQEARLDAQVTEQEKIIQEYIKNEQTIEKNREIRSQISNIRTNLSNVKNELKIINTNVLKLNGQVSSLQNQKETIEERIREVRELEEQHGLFQYYLNAFRKGWCIV
jgi:predicted  nucleic acid-binding Zn-ribbon protein